MEIRNIDTSKGLNLGEGIIFEAIDTYINNTRYPKSLVLRKLELQKKELVGMKDKIALTVKGADNQVEVLKSKSTLIQGKINRLLAELKRDLGR